MKLAILFTLSLVIMLGLDFVWLTTATEPLYRPFMGDIMAPEPNMVAAGLFYALYAFGLSYLIILPLTATEGRINHTDLTLRAGLFGLVAYGTYDLTALAVIRDWSVVMTAVDMAWGTVVTLVTANLAVFGLRLLGQIK